MASDVKRKVYIYEMSHTDLEMISHILDINDKWKELGSECLKLTMTDIIKYQNCFQRGRSPAYDMIWDWGSQNHTINELFYALLKIKQHHAMTFLKDYVNPRHHPFINEGDKSRDGFVTYKGKEPSEDYIPDFENSSVSSYSLPKPPIPSQKDYCRSGSKRVPEQGTEYGSTCEPLSCGKQYPNFACKSKESLYFVKKSIDPENFNNASSDFSLPSKVLNLSENGKSAIELPKPPLPINISRGASEQVESIEDNSKVLVSVNSSERVTVIKPQREERVKHQDEVVSSQRKHSDGIESYMLPVTSYQDIVTATDNFSVKKELGKGGFGIVYEGYWQNTKVAIKRIIKKDNPGYTVFEEAKLQQSYVELKTLNKYRHDNILPLYGYSLSNDTLCLIYQYMVNGSLEDRLLTKNGTKPLTWKQRLVISCGSARGIQYLHNCDKQIIHGDIKSANILLDGNFEPKIGDFGLAREGPTSQGTFTISQVNGTQAYLPIDYIKNRKLSTKVDTYSFGIVLFELATGLMAYNESFPKHKFLRDYIMKANPDTYESMRDVRAGSEMKEAFMEFITLGKRCAADLKNQRPEMVQVLEKLEAIRQSIERKIAPVVKLDTLPSDFDTSMSSLNLQVFTNTSLSSNPLPPINESLQSSSIPSYNEVSSDVRLSSPNVPDLSILGINKCEKN